MDAHLTFPSFLEALRSIADHAGLPDGHVETHTVRLNRANLRDSLSRLEPGVLAIGDGRFLAVTRSSRSTLRVIVPGGGSADVNARDLIPDSPEALLAEAEQLAGSCGLPPGRRDRLVRFLVDERAARQDVATAWQVRLAPSAGFPGQLRRTGLFWRFGLLVASHAAQMLLLMFAWWSVGRGVLSGRLDDGWLLAWGLAVASTIPFRLLGTWLQGVVSLGIGGLLKQRLLVGAIRVDADLMRRLGAGQLLGQVIESESIEQLAAGGGLITILAAVELVFLAVILAFGASPVLETGVFLLWIVLIGAMVAAYARRRGAWTGWRLEITHRLVERLTGHRTRLAQQPPSEWHSGEDEETARYLELSRGFDRLAAALATIVPHGYLLAGLAALAPAFLSTNVPTSELAITLGAMLYGFQAMRRIAFGLTRLAAAWVAWEQVKPMFDAAGEARDRGLVEVAESRNETVLEAQDLVFRHPSRTEPVLSGCHLALRRGDFVLLEGSSGGGKSTLVSLLAGLRQPASGLVLASGLDWRTLGEEHWRRRIVLAPQYHENHVLAAPLWFNLLMGRGWPVTDGDQREAFELCQELGLGPLLERMPGGLDTMVGDTGWQLSHGERGRVYLARALLQGGDVIMLDESFAALDPETMHLCLECVFRRAGTLLVIAHP